MRWCWMRVVAPVAMRWLFYQQGYRVEAFDASPELVVLARQHTNLPVKHMTFTELDAVKNMRASGAALRYCMCPMPNCRVMDKLANALKPDGIWYLSFKYGDGEREQAGRRFSDMNESRLAGLDCGIARYRRRSRVDDAR